MPSPHLAELPEADGPTLMSYLGWLRRRWWILLLAAFLGSGAGLIITQLQTRSYISTTTLLVRQVGVDANAAASNTTTAKVNLDTEAQVVRSLIVADRARTLMASTVAPGELVKLVTVTVPPNSQVLQIKFEAGTPREAQAGSHAFAQAYLDLRTATATKSVENEKAAIKQQITDVTKQLSTVAGRIAGAPQDSAERERAEADRDVLTKQLATLNERMTPLLSPLTNPGEIISDANLPTKPSSPNRTLNLASGLGAGLLFGIVLALVMDRLDTRVRRGRDITDRLGLPVLLDLPSRSHSVAILPATHRVSRELGRLRNVLLTTVPEPRVRGNGRQLLITDASGGVAAGFVAGNLAAAYARTGQQVAVVTTKPDSPLTSMISGAAASYGLANVLRRDVSALKALTAVPGLPQLRVLLPGNLDAELELPVAAVLEVLAELAARFDHVLVETDSPTLAVEAQALASHVDAVIVVAETGRTRTGEIAVALRQFEQVDAPVLGAVLAPRMPMGAVAKAKTFTASSARAAAPAPPPDRGLPPRGAHPAHGAPSTRGGQPGPYGHGGHTGTASAPGKEPKPRVVIPPPSDSTMILPRMPQRDESQPNHPSSPAGPSGAMPSTGTGGSTTYGSPTEYGSPTDRGRGNRPGGPRLSVALDSGEDVG